MSDHGWIGVDLDGTLAVYDGWKGAEHIGEPVQPMVDRVKAWRAEGREVKIFTARVFGDTGEVAAVIAKWCFDHIGEVLPITCTKDYGMVTLWDDRAIGVVPNLGIPYTLTEGPEQHALMGASL